MYSIDYLICRDLTTNAYAFRFAPVGCVLCLWLNSRIISWLCHLPSPHSMCLPMRASACSYISCVCQLFSMLPAHPSPARARTARLYALPALYHFYVCTSLSPPSWYLSYNVLLYAFLVVLFALPVCVPPLST